MLYSRLAVRMSELAVALAQARLITSDGSLSGL